jgi:small subunit ribosomal protein S8
MHDEVRMPSSKQKVALAKLLEAEGYINGFEVSPSAKGPGDVLTIQMKYSEDRERTISGLRRVSTPACACTARPTPYPACSAGSVLPSCPPATG